MTLLSSLTTSSMMSATGALSSARLAGLIASVGRNCHFECVGIAGSSTLLCVPVAVNSVNAFDQFVAAAARLEQELARAIIGQRHVVREILIAFLAGGHCLLRGVPGLAKTLLIKTLAEAVDLKFNRIQFTPDLMPSDILGTEVIEEDRATGQRAIRFIRGPIFANIILADEINRTPPKTQAALLEAMQEYQVTVGGVRFALDRPLFVLATQNPIEQEGTYPLPEAQLDRFMFNVVIDYPTAEEERRILAATTAGEEPAMQRRGERRGDRAAARHRPRRARRRRTSSTTRRGSCARRGRRGRPRTARRNSCGGGCKWGAGPRAGQALLLGGKARALLDGRSVVAPDDIRAVALPVLRHRVLAELPGGGGRPRSRSGRQPAPGHGAAVIDPAVLTRIADLELVARGVVEGAVAGLHRSPFHGYSAEFSQYRPYRQGDDLKYVDWKLFARTDRIYTKQFLETTNVAVNIVHGSQRVDGVSGTGRRAREARLRARAVLRRWPI